MKPSERLRAELKQAVHLDDITEDIAVELKHGISISKGYVWNGYRYVAFMISSGLVEEKEIRRKGEGAIGDHKITLKGYRYCLALMKEGYYETLLKKYPNSLLS